MTRRKAEAYAHLIHNIKAQFIALNQIRFQDDEIYSEFNEDFEKLKLSVLESMKDFEYYCDSIPDLKLKHKAQWDKDKEAR